MRRFLVILIALISAAVLLVVAFLGVFADRTSGLESLFEGAEATAPPPPVGDCPRLVYDLHNWGGDYTTPEGAELSHLEALRPRRTVRRLEYVDGAGRDAFEERMRRRAALDASTGPTRIVRLQSPTVYRERYAPRFLTLLYPTEGALFPSNLCAPLVEWTDPQNDLWQVTVAVPAESLEWKGISETRRWRIPDEVWDELRRAAVDADATVTVRGVKHEGTGKKQRETVHVSGTVRLRVSRDEADPAVIYRLVDPPFARYKTPDMFVREIARKEHRTFLKARRLYCFNCHTFSRKAPGGKMALQVRYMGMKKFERPVYFAVHDLDKQETMCTALPFKLQMTTFMAWSPDETKLAFSANQALVTLPPTTLETQFAAQPTSDIAVYDSARDVAFLLPGASLPDRIEVYPRWSPDGNAVIYCNAPAGVHPALTKLQLWMVPYNGGAGGRGRPVPFAQDEKKSSYYPRFSPDGRWFTFVRSNGGSLIKSSSDICIMPADFSRPPRPLASNVPFAADSWYSWSSNSRWIVFASKRDDGVFARLYMTHIDENGRASPAVRLPVSDLPMMSFNIPEFVAAVPEVTERDLYDGVRVENQPVFVGRPNRKDDASR